MNRKTKKKWKQRIFGYLFEMKQGEEQKVAATIANDIEIYVMDLNTQMGEQEDFIMGLKNQIKKLQGSKSDKLKTCKNCGGIYQDISKFCLLCGEKLVSI